MKFLVLSGDGINCEKETLLAIKEAGGDGDIVHISSFSENPNLLKSYKGLVLPGGFSFGDELGSGQILALKLKSLFEEALFEFVEKGHPVIGICNGFQVLMKLNILPNIEVASKVALTENISAKFINRWTRLRTSGERCLWTKGIGSLDLPIRHGEGRIIVDESFQDDLKKLIDDGHAPLLYDEDVNGSFESIAGLCNEKGNVLGLMPHPEAYLYPELHPDRLTWDQNPTLGLHLFKNAVEYIQNHNNFQ
ncbi:MAG: phosphoribosylformylglycinamidine synthase subunit PurQ [Bacteriovoracaceae bacterium]